MSVERTRANVLLLAAQAVSLGVAVAFLVIAANGLFLPAYGAEWLPLTYIGVALFGAGASILIARALRRWALPAVAVAILGVFAAVLLVGWGIVAATGSAWPSVTQLVGFPILLQLGFVIIGGQAGRLLDLQQIKRYFPGIVAGFVAGFTLGGFAAIPVLDLVGGPEHLVIFVAAGCALFAVLILVTARRRPFELAVVDQPTSTDLRPSLRSLLTSRFVFLLSIYQVLSAMASQVLDFLLFDRAAARYPDATELTQFVAVYTGILNAVDLVFLLVVAGWVLRRFGLHLGLLANPAGITALTLAMLIAAVGPGPSSLALFTIVATTRVADIALTDGMTRGSINAVFQVVPVEERLAVQAGVEGIGVPLAIGATGALLLAINALDLGTNIIVAFALLLCAAWSVAAIVVYRDYRRELATRLRRRTLDLDSALPVAADEQAAVRRLLLTDDVRDVRLGLDLAVMANLSSADLASLADHEDRVVRLTALEQLARRGDEDAASRAGTIARQLAGSDDGLERRAAAVAFKELDLPDRQDLLGRLLADSDQAVRIAALGSVGRPHDDELVQINAMEHGNLHDVTTKIYVVMTLDEDRLAIDVADEGRSGVAPVDVDEPDVGAQIDGLEAPGGMGLFVIKALVDEAEFVPPDLGFGNQFRMVIHVSPKDPS